MNKSVGIVIYSNINKKEYTKLLEKEQKRINLNKRQRRLVEKKKTVSINRKRLGKQINRFNHCNVLKESNRILYPIVKKQSKDFYKELHHFTINVCSQPFTHDGYKRINKKYKKLSIQYYNKNLNSPGHELLKRQCFRNLQAENEATYISSKYIPRKPNSDPVWVDQFLTINAFEKPFNHAMLIENEYPYKFVSVEMNQHSPGYELLKRKCVLNLQAENYAEYMNYDHQIKDNRWFSIRDDIRDKFKKEIINKVLSSTCISDNRDENIKKLIEFGFIDDESEYVGKKNYYNYYDNCSICFEKLGLYKDLLSCDGTNGKQHLFHSECLTKWTNRQKILLLNENCPLCKDSINFSNSYFNIKGELLNSAKEDEEYHAWEENVIIELRTNTWTNITSEFQYNTTPREYYESIYDEPWWVFAYPREEENEEEEFYIDELAEDEEGFWLSRMEFRDRYGENWNEYYEVAHNNSILGGIQLLFERIEIENDFYEGELAEDERGFWLSRMEFRYRHGVYWNEYYEVAHYNSILGSIQYLFERNIFKNKYPEFQCPEYLRNKLDELIDELNVDSAQELLDEINECQCCIRHQTNRYRRIGDEPIIGPPENNPNLHLERDCNCNCRHVSRFIGNYFYNSYYYESERSDENYYYGEDE